MLESEELEDRQVDSRVEAQSTLVWAESTVELDTVGAVDLGLELVVFPDDAGLDDALWDGDDLQGGLVFGVLLEEGGVLEGRGQLWEGGQYGSISLFSLEQRAIEAWRSSRWWK